MSTCLYPPANNQPTDAQQDDPLNEMIRQAGIAQQNQGAGNKSQTNCPPDHFPCLRCGKLHHAQSVCQVSQDHVEPQHNDATPVTIGALRHLNKQMEKLKNRMLHLERQVSNALPEIAKTIPDMPPQDNLSVSPSAYMMLCNQVDDLYKRIDELTTTFNNVAETYHRDLNGRLRKLEEFKNIHNYIQIPREYDERISQLEKDIKFIHSALNAQIGISRAPYKCPVCYGTGFFDLVSLEDCIKNNGCKTKQCVSCEGKGIVWG